MDESAMKALEAEILSALDEEKVDFSKASALLGQISGKQFMDEKNSLAEILAEKALDSEAFSYWLDFQSQLTVAPDKEEKCRKELLATIYERLGKGANIRAFAEHSGLTGLDPLPESLHRLARLLQFQEGSFVYDRTWGSGVVSDVDAFYGRITVDFDRKKFHELAMRYAAESLLCLEPDHILARKRTEPEVVNQMVKDAPDDVVKELLKSFGPMSVAVLQEMVTEHFVPESGWKKFWDLARKGLKRDSKVKIPAKRSELIEMASDESSFDASWFHKLLKTRRIPEIFEQLTDLNENFDGDLSEEARAAIGDRLQHVVKGSMNRPELIAQTIQLACEIGGELPGFDLDGDLDGLMQESKMRMLFERMSSRDLTQLFLKMLERREESFPSLLLKLVPHMDATTLQLTCLILEGRSDQAAVYQEIRRAVSQRETDPNLILWLWRNRELCEENNIVHRDLLLDLTLISLEGIEQGGRLRAQTQIRDLFKQPTWVQVLLDELPRPDAFKLLKRIKDSTAWPELDRRSVLGLMIKAKPELESVMSSKSGDDDEAASVQQAVTSHRSYVLRQKQLQKIVNEDIPNNSREIGVARSHGDLRENFEYQAAKDHQGILMRRQAELEAMLNEVQATDFVGYTSDVAGIATQVVLRFQDGSEETYCILGVWDQDEAHRIISCETRLAQLLKGKKPGEVIEIPDDTGMRMCTLVSVSPIPHEIQDWIREEPELAGASDKVVQDGV